MKLSRIPVDLVDPARAVLLILVLALVFAGCGDEGGPVSSEEGGEDASQQEGVHFADAGLEKAVREALGKPAGALTGAELLSLTQLSAQGRGVGDITGLEQLKKLQALDLADNRIAEIGPLAGLVELRLLDLEGNQVRDLAPLAALNRLEHLVLAGNRVREIAVLLDLAGLQSVDLSGNPLGAVAISEQLAALEAAGVEVRFVLPLREPEGSLLFSSDPSGNYEIYAVDVDGGNLARLTDDPGDARFPAWSPDYERIAFASNRSGDWEIYAMAPDGSGLARLTEHAGFDGFPAWSPDGAEIAFVREGAGFDIYAIAADGSGLRRLTDDPVDEVDPSWSPDGREIAFAANRSGRYGIYVMETGGVTLLSAADSVDCRYPAWSPDGAEIAFSRLATEREEGRIVREKSDICVMPATGGEVVEVTGDVEEDCWGPAWSPDGHFLAFFGETEYRSDVYWAPVIGGGATQMATFVARNEFPAWCPMRVEEYLAESPFALEPEEADPDTPVHFADAYLEAAVREALGIFSDEPLTRGEVEGLAELTANLREIADLSGLETLSNLKSLHLMDNDIVDLSPVGELSHLGSLWVSWNEIRDLSPVANLTNLYALYALDNEIEDLAPLAGLTRLVALSLGSNPIRDLSPLSGLVDLSNLSIANTQIEDLSPLLKLEALRKLNARRNPLSEDSLNRVIPALQERGVEVLY